MDYWGRNSGIDGWVVYRFKAGMGRGMSLQIKSAWEYQLLTWAEEALRTQVQRVTIHADSSVLTTAYHHCDALTRVHSRTFHLASGLLPEEKRRATRALYAFCRITDNIVDSPESDAQRTHTLESWRATISAEHPPTHELVALAWADAQQRFNIPRGYAQQLIDGVKRDLTQKRYETFADLAEYSYGVASTVGLMAMHIIGFATEESLPYAVKLGVALQLTNILRDIAEDWQAGRFYLPQEELHAFELTEDDIAQRVATGDAQVDDRWRKFMRFQVERNRTLYRESLPGIALLDPDGRLAIAAAAELYEAILQDIEKHDYNVFNRRAHVGLVGKVTRLPGIWWRSRTVKFKET